MIYMYLHIPVLRIHRYDYLFSLEYYTNVIFDRWFLSRIIFRDTYDGKNQTINSRKYRKMKKYFLKGPRSIKFLFLYQVLSNLLNFKLNLATLINVVLDIKILKIYASTEKNYK